MLKHVLNKNNSLLHPGRLFVPLAKGPFSWFAEGTKSWELRRYGRVFTIKHIYIGRVVELRCGYSGKQSVWGVIEEVVVAPNLEEIFLKIDYQKILPYSLNKVQAIIQAGKILGIEPSTQIQLIAFKVRQDDA